MMVKPIYVLAAMIGCHLSLADVRDRPERHSDEIQKFALLIGINEYKSPEIRDLKGCLNDIDRMDQLLITKYGFQGENIVKLINQEASRNSIISVFESHLIDKPRSDDIVLFYFSGHGSTMQDSDKGDELDNIDESIVPYDSRIDGVFDISDDELENLFNRVKSKNVTYIMDACHSGSATRGSAAKKIEMDPRRPPVTSLNSQDGSIDGFRATDASYVLIAACRSEQLAYEHVVGENIYGALTYFLTEELMKANGQITYRDIMDNIKGQVNSYYPSQNPHLEGALADNYVFSDRSSVVEKHLLITQVDQGKAFLSAGSIHGLSVGSIYEVYSPGTKDFTSKGIAQLEVSKVMASTAEAIITSGTPVPPNSRAVEREHQYNNSQLQIFFEGLWETDYLRDLLSEVKELAFINEVPQKSTAHLVLNAGDQNVSIALADDPDNILASFPLNQTDQYNQIVSTVTKWASWFNTLSITNPNDSIQITLDVVAVDDSGTRGPMNVIGKTDFAFKEGERFDIVIRNTSNRPLYLHLLNLETTGTIQLLYPKAGRIELVNPKSELYKRLKGWIPPGLTKTRDIIKVFATTDPTMDLGFLRIDATDNDQNRPSTNQFNSLIDYAIYGDGNRTVKPTVKPIKLNNWSTVQRVIAIEK